MERKIGVYICHCGSNIAGTVDVEKVAEFAGTVAKPDAYFNLGRMYEQRMDDEKAEAAYRKVVEEFPDSVHADVARGKLVRFEG
jgi:heterodisulfide reductase subunit A